MKIFITTGSLVLISLQAFSQWDTSNLPKIFYNTGNVGIGTNSPGSLLHLKSGTFETKFIGGNQIDFTRDYANYITASNTSGFLYFGTGGRTQDLTLSAAGNLGIGTTTPAVKLEVNGDVNIGTNNGVLNGYGTRINLLGAGLNGDPLWLSRYNNGSNQSELRVNIGDDYGQAQDMFVVGTHHWNGGAWFPHLAVQASGNVGIGTTTTDAKLTVNGTVHAKEVKVDLNVPGPDYVFEPDYKLRSLEEIKNYIEKHKHLPEVPSAKEMETNGVNVSEMNMLLLRKIEELTLHLIEQNKIIAQLQEESRTSPEPSGKKIEELTLHVIELKNENEGFKKRIEIIENKK